MVMIERDEVDGVAIVRLTHGPVNALDLELVNAIAASFAELAGSHHRAVVFTGAGRAFSAGVDLRRIVDGGEAYVRSYVPALSAAFTAVFDVGKPVVAALNGHAIAGGAILAYASDVRLMSAGRIGVPELLVGVPFPTAALEILRYAIGDPRLAMLRGETVEPAVAHSAGLVDRVVDAEALLASAVEEADRLARFTPATTYRLTKRQLQADTRARIARDRDAIDPDVTELWVQRAADGTIARYLDSLRG